MKIKTGYILRKMVKNYMAIPVGGKTTDFDGMITLNETGAFLWRQMEQDTDVDTLVEALQKEYDVSRERAISSVERIIEKLQKADLLV